MTKPPVMLPFSSIASPEARAAYHDNTGTPSAEPDIAAARRRLDETSAFRCSTASWCGRRTR